MINLDQGYWPEPTDEPQWDEGAYLEACAADAAEAAYGAAMEAEYYASLDAEAEAESAAYYREMQAEMEADDALYLAQELGPPTGEERAAADAEWQAEQADHR